MMEDSEMLVVEETETNENATMETTNQTQNVVVATVVPNTTASNKNNNNAQIMMKEQIQSIKKLLEVCHTTIGTLESNVDKLIQKNDEKEEQQRKEKDEQHERTTKELTDLRTEYTTLDNKYKSLQSDVVKLKEELHMKETEIKVMSSNNGIGINEINKARKELLNNNTPFEHCSTKGLDGWKLIQTSVETFLGVEWTYYKLAHDNGLITDEECRKGILFNIFVIGLIKRCAGKLNLYISPETIGDITITDRLFKKWFVHINKAYEDNHLALASMDATSTTATTTTLNNNNAVVDNGNNSNNNNHRQKYYNINVLNALVGPEPVPDVVFTEEDLKYRYDILRMLNYPHSRLESYQH